MKVVRPGWLWRFAAKNPAILLTLSYLAACAMGMLAISAQLYRFGLRVFDVATPADVFAVGISQPIGLFTLIAMPLCAWAWIKYDESVQHRWRYTMLGATALLVLLASMWLFGDSDASGYFSPRVVVEHGQDKQIEGDLVASLSNYLVIRPVDPEDAVASAVIIPASEVSRVRSLEFHGNYFWMLPAMVLAVLAVVVGANVAMAKFSGRLD